MRQASSTALHERLEESFDETIETGSPLLVIRQGGRGNVVVMSESEFAGWEETVRLLSSLANAARLMASVAAARGGQASERDLVDPATADT